MAVKFIDCPSDRIGDLRAFFSEMYWPEYVLAADEEFLKWQFGPTSAGRHSDYHLILSVIDGAIKGCIGYIPIEVSMAGQSVPARWAANWMVDDSTRRLGIGPLLMRELVKRFPITLALGGNRDAHDLLPRMGWTDFGCLNRYVAVLDRDAAGLLTEQGSIDWPGVAGPRPGTSAARRVDRFDEDVTALWDRTWGMAAGTRRTAEFLNWRYTSHPSFEHRLFEQRCDGRLKGVAVSRIESVRDAPVRICRLLELFGDDEAVPDLLAGVMDDARTSGAAAVDFFCSSHRMDMALHAAGFLNGEQAPATEIPILFQPIDRQRKGILFMASLKASGHAANIPDWYVTKSDGDQDRPA